MYIEAPSFRGLEQIYQKRKTVKRSRGTTSGRGGRGSRVNVVGYRETPQKYKVT